MNEKYEHPYDLATFEKVYYKEHEQEIESCDRWIKWCKQYNDTHGMNFHQGMRAALVFHHQKMQQLLSVFKQQHPNKKQ